jgi:hypothetical protein
MEDTQQVVLPYFQDPLKRKAQYFLEEYHFEDLKHFLDFDFVEVSY